MLLLATCIISPCYGQTIDNTWGTWTSIKFQKKLDRGFKLFISPEIRTSKQQIDKYIVQTGFSYKLNKNFSTSAIYRFTSEQKKKGPHNYGRIGLDVKGQAKMGRFKPQLRIRYTNIVDSDDDESTRYFRYKGGVDYNIKKSSFSPFAYAEAFQKLNGIGLTKWRYSLGTEYKINKKNLFDISYRLDNFISKDLRRHIVNTTYTHKF